MEKKLLKFVVELFNKKYGLQMEFEEYQRNNCNARIDAVLRLKTQDIEFKFSVEAKSVVNSSVIGFMLHHKNDSPYTPLLVSNYVNPIMAEKLKKNEINFIDAVGNAYINTPSVFIFVKGNRKAKTHADSSVGKAFTPSGIKMIYALLCDEMLINKPYREIAKASGVALGTVGRVIDNLSKLGFVIDMGSQGKKLTKNKALFDRWCVDYAEKLKPKLLIGLFEGADDFLKRFRLKPDQGQWGGEVAAFKLTNYLKPENAVIYVKDGNIRDIVIQNKLKKTEKGNIRIYQKFWTNNAKQDKSNAHPFVIYADLLELNNQRTSEAAKNIYDQIIVGYFRKS